MAPVKIFNTLSEKKEVLKKSSKGVKLFVCGPTVYDAAHLGHARTYVVFDAMVRYLRNQGYKVFYLQNITDIDDRILERAKILKKEPLALARDQEKEYLDDMKTLGVTAVNKYVRASAHLKEIHQQIKILIKKGYAYQTKSGVYFEVKKFPNYGKLSRQNLEGLRPGWRIEPDPEKKDPLDFALWKKNIENPSTGLGDKGSGNTFGFPSPWGWGRPGWHIEDTAITERYFGVQYDLHGAAVDLKFPHHESEIAQQEAASGKRPFVKIWMHAGFLLVNGEKMSKSLGNFITVNEFLKKYPPEVLRMLILSHHYRSPINYADDLPDQIKKAINNIVNLLIKLSLLKTKPGKQTAAFKKALGDGHKKFIASLNDDFNTPKAMALIFKLIGKFHQDIFDFNKEEGRLLADFIKDHFGILGIDFKMPKIPVLVSKLVKERVRLRKKNDFARADTLRKRIEQQGYNVEDTPLGPVVMIS